jgi:hypothetical protein
VLTRNHSQYRVAIAIPVKESNSVTGAAKEDKDTSTDNASLSLLFNLSGEPIKPDTHVMNTGVEKHCDLAEVTYAVHRGAPTVL